MAWKVGKAKNDNHAQLHSCRVSRTRERLLGVHFGLESKPWIQFISRSDTVSAQWDQSSRDQVVLVPFSKYSRRCSRRVSPGNGNSAVSAHLQIEIGLPGIFSKRPDLPESPSLPRSGRISRRHRLRRQNVRHVYSWMKIHFSCFVLIRGFGQTMGAFKINDCRGFPDRRFR
jgi:hypothetical protein